MNILEQLHKNNWNIWTFDKSDARKYHLKYNSQFFFNSLKPIKSDIQYDILFIGRDKGRAGLLNSLKMKFEELGFVTYFYIRKKNNWYFRFLNLGNTFITYQSVLDCIGRSKAILDIVQEGQIGLTLRPLEALFFEKKLITNNQDIENYDFYDKQNIFILGKNDFSGIKNFMHGPIKPISKEVKDFYCFASWLNRFE